MGTVVGIVMAAIGGSKLASATSSKDVSTDYDLQRAGYILLLVVVILLTVYAMFTIMRLRRQSYTQGAVRDALILTYCALAAIIFVYVRLIYSIIYAFDRSPRLSPLTATFAVRFVLIFLTQLLAALCLVTGGIITRNIAFKSG
jgi:hypothetical protein